MGQAMACSQNSKLIREVAALIDDTVSAFRNRGYTREVAIQQAALALGMPPRRAKALIYGEAFSMAADEYAAIKARFVDHLDDEAASLAARFEAVKARRKQLELDLDNDPVGNSILGTQSPRQRTGLGDGVGHSRGA